MYLLSLVIGSIATGFALGCVFMLVRLDINAAILAEHLQRLIAAGNIDRAIKLCVSADRSIVANAAHAGLVASNSGSSITNGTDVETRRAQFDDAYRAELADQMPRATRIAPLGRLAGLLGAAAIAVGATAEPITIAAVALGLLGVLGALLASDRQRRLKRNGHALHMAVRKALVDRWSLEAGAVD